MYHDSQYQPSLAMRFRHTSIAKNMFTHAEASFTPIVINNANGVTNMQMTDATAHVLNILQVNCESTDVSPEGLWGVVYLDNAIPRGWTKHQFAGHLADLKKLGLYRPMDQYFGRVKLED